MKLKKSVITSTAALALLSTAFSPATLRAYVYADGENFVNSMPGQTLTVNGTGVATQSGNLTGTATSNVLKTGTGTLLLRGNNSAFLGKIQVSIGVLDVATSQNLGVPLNRLEFASQVSQPANGALRAAVLNVVAGTGSPADVDAAFATAFSAGVLGRLRVADGGSIVADAGGSNANRSSMFSGYVENIHLGAGASFTAKNSVTTTPATFNGGTTTITGNSLFALTTADATGRFTYSGNAAPALGGALYNAGGTAYITNTTFSGNAATDAVAGKGGAFANASVGVNNARAYFSNSLFLANAAANAGGAFTNQDGAAATFSGVTFSDNQVTGATGRGGAIYNFNSTINLTGGALTGNKALGTAVGGGAIYNDGAAGQVNLNGVLVSGNSAQTGGAIHAALGITSVNDSVVTGNTSVGNGGAVYAAGNGFLIRNSSFTNNTAGGLGGAVYLDANTAASGVVTLIADAGKTVLIAGNKSAGGASDGIYFGQTGLAQNSPFVNIFGAGTITVLDPIVANVNNGKQFAVQKTESGTFRWGGANVLAADNGANIFLYGGTTRFADGFSLSAGGSIAPANNIFVGNTGNLVIEHNATILAGFALNIQAGSTLEILRGTLSAGKIGFNGGTKLRFGFASATEHGVIDLGSGGDFFYGDTGTEIFFDIGALDLSGISVVDLIRGLSPAQVQDFTYNGARLSVGDKITLNGTEFALTHTGGNLSLVNTNPIPEPSTYALFGALGLAGVALLRRKKTPAK